MGSESSAVALVGGGSFASSSDSKRNKMRRCCWSVVVVRSRRNFSIFRVRTHSCIADHQGTLGASAPCARLEHRSQIKGRVDKSLRYIGNLWGGANCAIAGAVGRQLDEAKRKLVVALLPEAEEVGGSGRAIAIALHG